MALLHNSLSGGPAPVSNVKEAAAEDHGIHRYAADHLILYALSGKMLHGKKTLTVTGMNERKCFVVAVVCHKSSSGLLMHVFSSSSFLFTL